MGHTKPAVEVVPRFRVGDVVVTRGPVSIRVIGTSGSDGWADPGWRWLVMAVVIEGRVLRYKVVAESAPQLYHQLLRESQIAKRVEPKKKG
jgi:hypothetical protein